MSITVDAWNLGKHAIMWSDRPGEGSPEKDCCR